MTRWFKWTLRLLLAIGAPILFLVLLEAALRLCGFGHPTHYFLPAGHGAYVANPRYSSLFLGNYLSRPTVPVVLLRQKPPRTFRIFVFGSSAARGEPNPAFSFARILEAMLSERFPGVRFEVINTAVTATNSHVVRRTVRDCRDFGGDLYIVYMGNNEVIGPYGAGTVFPRRSPSLTGIRAAIWLRSTRIGQLVASLSGDEKKMRRVWRGMAMFTGFQVRADDPRLQVVYDNFRENLEDICAEARRANVPLIVSTVVSNLKDIPPFLSAHRNGLTAVELAAWKKAFQLGSEHLQASRYDDATRCFLEAARIDDRYAELRFKLGQCCLAKQQPVHARSHFEAARDLDALRFRADARINVIIRERSGAWAGKGVHLVDAEEDLLPAAGIPGRELFYEHVHFRFEGNYKLAAAIFPRVVTLLPAEARGGPGVAGQPVPPTPDQCAQWLAYTVFDRFTNAQLMFRITSGPPFQPEYAAQFQKEQKWNEPYLTSPAFEEMEHLYRERLRERPDDLLLRTDYAHLACAQGHLAEAEAEYRKVVARYPSEDSHFLLGEVLAAQAKTDEAIEQFRAALRDMPGHIYALRMLAMSYRRLNRLKEDAATCRTILDLMPDDKLALDELRQLESLRESK